MNIHKCFVQPAVQPAAKCKRTFEWNCIYYLGAYRSAAISVAKNSVLEKKLNRKIPCVYYVQTARRIMAYQMAPLPSDVVIA